MADTFERQTVSFVIRLWREPATSATGKDDLQSNAQWRGQIEYVPTGEKAHFQISSALWQFITHHLPLLPGDSEVTDATGAEAR